jgi:hypothetical protein
VTKLEEAAAALRARVSDREVAGIRASVPAAKLPAWKIRENRRKRTGKPKFVTFTPAGQEIIAGARAAFRLNMSEVVDSALKEWARTHDLDDVMTRRLRGAMYPGEGAVRRIQGEDDGRSPD